MSVGRHWEINAYWPHHTGGSALAGPEIRITGYFLMFLLDNVIESFEVEGLECPIHMNT